MAFVIDHTCRIHPSARINVRHGFIGKHAVINENVVIEGHRIEIGREAFVDRNATIGGGSCFDSCAFLVAGDWFHMGVNSQVNIARGVSAGHEVGIGIDSKIFTHGAYLDCINVGAPVQWGGVTLGDNVWLPNAWVNPGVTIGSNVVVGARSLVTRSIPSGALAAGSPAKIVRESVYGMPIRPEAFEELVEALIQQIEMRFLDHGLRAEVVHTGGVQLTLHCDEGDCYFHLSDKSIAGKVSEASIVAKDQLRRNGIRFRYEAVDGEWKRWS